MLRRLCQKQQASGMLTCMKKSLVSHSTLTSKTTIRLDPAAYDFADPEKQRKGQAIASATEATRKSLYCDASWGTHIPFPPRGLASVAQPREPRTVADLLPWPALLTMHKCADEAASRAGCDREAIMQFALSICPVEQWVTLMNFMAQDSAIAQTAKILSPLIRGLKAKEARIKQGASDGGKKSARERQKQSPVPDTQTLLKERTRLLDAGKAPKDIAGILAERYGVTPNTVRRKFRATAQGKTN